MRSSVALFKKLDNSTKTYYDGKLYEAVRKINQVYELWASAYELSLYEVQIYYEMMKNVDTKITQKDLCTRLDAPKTSINSIMKKQLQNGYIEMTVNPDNKREKVLSLTEKGNNLAKGLVESMFRCEEEAAAMIDPQKLENAIATQNEFADNLLQKVEQIQEKQKWMHK